jgi:predicted DNA-binding protein with PD1-like motif
MKSLLAIVGLHLVLAGPGMKAAEAPSVHTIQSPIDRVIVVRLKNKTDMLDGLKQAIEREKIKNAVIISAFGSVSAYHIHVVNNTAAPYKDVFTKGTGPFDVLTVSGMVIDGRIHAHITLSDPRKTTGGHLEPGTTVLTFATITLGVLSDSSNLARIDDPEWR